MSKLTNNTSFLQDILNTINNLPEAGGGTELPELTNEGSASDLLSGKQLIDSEGNVVTGTIETKTVSNLSASGATVTVPAGYYSVQATKSVGTTSLNTPSVSIDTNGKITASITQSAGYISAGTKSATKQLSTQAAKTITPSTSAQTVLEKNVYTNGTITVSAIPSKYVDVSGTTATLSDVLSGKTFGAKGSVNTGTIQTFDGSYECSGESTGGGTGVNTCTVVFEELSADYLVSRYIDGSVVITDITGNGEALTFTDVICGSPIVCTSAVKQLRYENTTFVRWNSDSNRGHFIAPSDPNVITTVWYSDDVLEDEIPDQ